MDYVNTVLWRTNYNGHGTSHRRRGSPSPGGRAPDPPLAVRARSHPGQGREGEWPERRLPVPDRERQGVTVAVLPVRAVIGSRCPDRLVPRRRDPLAGGDAPGGPPLARDSWRSREQGRRARLERHLDHRGHRGTGTWDRRP